MKEIKLIIPGKPVAKKRPRFARRGNFVKTYNCQETEEGRFLWEVKNQWQGEPLEGALEVVALFVMPTPKTTSKKTAEAMKAEQVPHTKKPDIDNIIKFSYDVLNGVAWKDDGQVAAMSVRKVGTTVARSITGSASSTR